MRSKLTALQTAKAMTEKLCSTGKRNAVGNKSRSTVANSALVLRRPTSPPTAGLKPEASPPSDVGVGVDVGVSSQLKSWGVAQPQLLDDSDIDELRKFFELLDEWDRRRVE